MATSAKKLDQLINPLASPDFLPGIGMVEATVAGNVSKRGPKHFRYDEFTSGFIKHGWLENPLWRFDIVGKSLMSGSFSNAMFDYQRV